LFHEFVQSFAQIYGENNVSYNVHNLYHIVDDVRRLGTLDKFSAFPFENELQNIKRLIRSGNNQLQQIANRMTENILLNADTIDLNNSFLPRLNKPDLKVSSSLRECTGYFREAVFEMFSLVNFKEGDKYFLSKNNEIVEFLYGTCFQENEVIYGKQFKFKTNFYNDPFQSSLLNIYKCEKEYLQPKLFEINEVKCKLFRMQLSNEEYVFFPLLHTKDF
jgi:hypothetical protein